MVSFDFYGLISMLPFLIMFICAIRASRRPHRGLLKCFAHYARSSAPMLGALSVVRRVALPPMETGLSYSRLISPAIIASYGLLACAVAVVMFVGICRRKVRFPPTSLLLAFKL